MQHANEATRTYAIDSTHSNVHFSVRHLMISNVRGTFRGIAGQIVLPADSLVPRSVVVTIDASAIDRGSFEIVGQLEIRGVRRAELMSAAVAGFGKDPWGNERGLNWNQALEAGGFAVGDDIEITIDVEAIPQPVPAAA